MTSKLFESFSTKTLTLPNRVVMAPMTRQRSPDGVPDEEVATYYRRRAEGGCGLIITEGTTVNHDVASLDDQTVPRFHGADALAGWKQVVDAVHGAGSQIFPQLWHVGMMRDPRKSQNPKQPSAGPSGLLKPGKKIAEPMSDGEIDQVIAAFVSAAVDAQKLGFNGVELHGAHGYLIDQFFWAATNQRSDHWGGNLAQRTRFAVEIVSAIRDVVGPDFPICLRYSQWKQQDYSQRLADSPQELSEFLEPLCNAGVDLFHCSTRRYWDPEFEGSELNLAGWTKKITGKPTITVGSVGLDSDFINTLSGQDVGGASLDALQERLERAEFDLVAVGRMLIADPEWPEKIKNNRLNEILSFQKEAIGVYP